MTRKTWSTSSMFMMHCMPGASWMSPKTLRFNNVVEIRYPFAICNPHRANVLVRSTGGHPCLVSRGIGALRFGDRIAAHTDVAGRYIYIIMDHDARRPRRSQTHVIDRCRTND